MAKPKTPPKKKKPASKKPVKKKVVAKKPVKKSVKDPGKKKRKKRVGAPKGNQYALGNKGGRPRMYESFEEMEEQIVKYFDQQKIKYTVNGLALFLGFAGKSGLYKYLKDLKRKEFVYPLKRAISVIEMVYEEKLHSSNAAGAIFALKNFGWKDTNALDISSAGKQIHVFIPDNKRDDKNPIKKPATKKKKKK